MGGELQTKTVMVVDDDRELLDQIAEVLTMEGYKVAAFSDSVKAANVVAEVMPDLVLLDLRMDGHSGFDLANRISHRPETSHIPVIAMTAYYKEGTYNGLMQIVGIMECLRKPFKPEEMLRMIASVLTSKRQSHGGLGRGLSD